MKTDIFNLIIIDESGSMSDVKKQTISGCNETIDTIKLSQKKFAETQNHYVSVYLFQSGSIPSRYLLKNVPAYAVEHVSNKDYEPMGCTPLFDAVGSTLTDLILTVKHKKDAIGSVTIITDGYENSSTDYSLSQISQMISQLKEKGWCFNFIGANIDVNVVAQQMEIDNALSFKQDDEGMKEMFRHERESRMAYNTELDNCLRCTDNSEEKRRENLKRAAKGFFHRRK